MGEKNVRFTKRNHREDGARAGFAFGLEAQRLEAELVGIEVDCRADVAHEEFRRDGHELARMQRRRPLAFDVERAPTLLVLSFQGLEALVEAP